MAGKANLTYYIYEGTLVGTVNGGIVNLTAVSGGGGASRKGITDSSVVNNPYMTGKKTTYQGKSNATSENRGGPIPCGRYEIEKPVVGYGYKYARLNPTGSTAKSLTNIGRGGFLIHATGALGSDGCIVPLSFPNLKELMDDLEKDEGGILYVLETTSGFRFA
jgi:hypothetical protein